MRLALTSVMGGQSLSGWFQELLVFTVLGATIYFAILHNDGDIIYNLVTLCFGYYFGQRGSNPPPSKS